MKKNNKLVKKRRKKDDVVFVKQVPMYPRDRLKKTNQKR